MPSYAVQEAQALNSIGFPEFTTKLISDVFNTLVATNMSQTEMYLSLVKEVSKSLSEFINSTKDDIGGDMILQFLTKVLPDKESDTEGNLKGTLITENNSASLTDEQATHLNNNVKIDGYEQPPINTNDSIATQYKTILDAVAARIAADKYTLLKEMVKLGVLRVVVERGEIETQLKFNTFASNFYQNQSDKYNRSEFNFNASARTGGFFSWWVKASASTSYTSLAVSTENTTTNNQTGTDIQLSGRVKIVFKTDYQPLNI